MLDLKETKANENIKKDFLNLMEEENFEIRFLEEDDYNKSYFDLLNYLTTAPTPRYEEWKLQYDKVTKSNIHIIVVEDVLRKIIVGSISVIIENKFIRNLGKVSHIEDVVVLPEYRNKKFGTKLIKLAIKLSQDSGCYKIILDSRDDAMGFYEKLGFSKRSEGMALYF